MKKGFSLEAKSNFVRDDLVTVTPSTKYWVRKRLKANELTMYLSHPLSDVYQWQEFLNSPIQTVLLIYYYSYFHKQAFNLNGVAFTSAILFATFFLYLYYILILKKQNLGI